MKTKITAKPLPESENGYKIDLSEATQEARKEAQELAFELGWGWLIEDQGKSDSFLSEPYMILSEGNKIFYGIPIFDFESNESTPITLTDLRAAVAYKKDQEKPKPKQERPVKVGIPYSNDAERKAAIRQAESYGYKEWENNENSRCDKDECIWLLERSGSSVWNDGWFHGYPQQIPLDRSFMEEEKPVVKKNFTTENFHTYPKSDYTPEPQDNGDILLRKVDKELEAAKSLILMNNWWNNLPESQYTEIDLEQVARLMVEFKNAE